MEKQYTVVAVYPMEGATVLEHVTADGPEGAVRAFWAIRGDDDGLSVADVFEGHLDSVMPYATWVDAPGSGGCEA